MKFDENGDGNVMESGCTWRRQRRHATKAKCERMGSIPTPEPRTCTRSFYDVVFCTLLNVRIVFRIMYTSRPNSLTYL